MSLVRVHNFSISLDGFGTGEGQSLETPFGHAAHLMDWMKATKFASDMFGTPGGSTGVDNAFAERYGPGIGAEIMGRRKFTPQTGPWDDLGTAEEWRGWWGDNPPFHTPVFVMTHFPRASFELEGGNVFHFVEGTPAEVLALAREAAGELDIRIGGGPSTVREFLKADLIDVMHLVQVPVVLGRGERLWDGLEGIEERYAVETVASPSGVTHFTFTRR